MRCNSPRNRRYKPPPPVASEPNRKDRQAIGAKLLFSEETATDKTNRLGGFKAILTYILFIHHIQSMIRTNMHLAVWHR